MGRGGHPDPHDEKSCPPNRGVAAGVTLVLSKPARVLFLSFPRFSSRLRQACGAATAALGSESTACPCLPECSCYAVCPNLIVCALFGGGCYAGRGRSMGYLGGHAVALLALCAGVSARQTSSFDTNWRFKLGDAGYAPACNTSAFSANLSGTFCKKASMVFVSSAELCESKDPLLSCLSRGAPQPGPGLPRS